MHMKKLSTLACAAAFAMLSGAASAQVSGNTVKVGVLTDMSGTYSDLAGAGAVLATEMAIADFIAEAKPEFKVEMSPPTTRTRPTSPPTRRASGSSARASMPPPSW